MPTVNRLEEIRAEVDRVAASSWWGDYPVEDVRWLIAALDEVLATWRPPDYEEEDGRDTAGA